MKRIIISALVLGASLNCFGTAEATYHNPYSNVSYIDMDDETEARYIDEKSTAIFNKDSTGRFTIPQANHGEYETPKGWQREVLSMGGTTVEKYTHTQNVSDRVVLFFHGGGYAIGLNNLYRDWGVHLAEIAGNATLLSVNYRYAPNDIFPAALDDAVNAYKEFLQIGYDPNKMIVIGDSAGGNLAAALALYLRDNNMPMPKLMVLISPWTYAGTDLPCREYNYHKDMMLGYKNKRIGAVLSNPEYFRGADVKNPYVSPVYGDLSGMPATLITAGGNDLLLDDTILYAAKARLSGVKIQETIYSGMSHDWTLFYPELKESRAMFKEIEKFISDNF